MVDEQGIIRFDEANELNIPIDIWLGRNEDEDGNNIPGWRLHAGCYQPKQNLNRGRVLPEAFAAVSDNREELQELVRRYVLPLYQVALSQIQGICDGTADHLYFWEEGGLMEG